MRRGRRTKAQREARELGQALDRFSRALIRRAAAGDLEALEALSLAKRAMDHAVGEAARALNEPCVWIGGQKVGYSWAEIGAAMGMSRQQAHRQYSQSHVKQLEQ